MTKCAKCGKEHSSPRRSCMDCGSPLPITCPKCGESNVLAIKFCTSCGEPLPREVMAADLVLKLKTGQKLPIGEWSILEGRLTNRSALPVRNVAVTFASPLFTGESRLRVDRLGADAGAPLDMEVDVENPGAAKLNISVRGLIEGRVPVCYRGQIRINAVQRPDPTAGDTKNITVVIGEGAGICGDITIDDSVGRDAMAAGDISGSSGSKRIEVAAESAEEWVEIPLARDEKEERVWSEQLEECPHCKCLTDISSERCDICGEKIERIVEVEEEPEEPIVETVDEPPPPEQPTPPPAVEVHFHGNMSPVAVPPPEEPAPAPPSQEAKEEPPAEPESPKPGLSLESVSPKHILIVIAALLALVSLFVLLNRQQSVVHVNIMRDDEVKRIQTGTEDTGKPIPVVEEKTGGTTSHKEPAPVRHQVMPTPTPAAKVEPGKVDQAQRKKKPPIKPKPMPINKFVVLPFENDDAGISDIIATDLAKSGLIPLVESSQVKSAASGSGVSAAGVDLGKIAESLRASQALLGSVNRHGGKISITLRLVHTQTKDVKFGDSAEGDAEDIFFMAHQLANRLHYRLTGEWIPRESMAGLAGKDKLQELAGLNPALFLSNKESSLKIELGLDRPEHSTYEQMSAMKIVFSVNQDCFITIYNIDSAGVVTLLYPNSYHRDNYIHSGVTHSIPSAYDGFDFNVSGVGGLESIIAIASTQPLFEFKELFRGGAVMPEFDSSATRFVTRAVHVTEKVRPKDWNSATVGFYLAAE